MTEFEIDYKMLFKSFNRRKKRKLKKSDKDLLEFLIKQQFVIYRLAKALEVGSYPTTEVLRNGAPLLVEPIEATLESVTYSDKTIKLHKSIRKTKNGSKSRRTARKSPTKWEL